MNQQPYKPPADFTDPNATKPYRNPKRHRFLQLFEALMAVVMFFGTLIMVLACMTPFVAIYTGDWEFMVFGAIVFVEAGVSVITSGAMREAARILRRLDK